MKFFFFAASLLLSISAISGGLIFGEPQFSGPGCPTSGVTSALSPNRNSLSILFNQSGSWFGAAPGSKRTFCGIAVTITSQNQTLVEADYRGFDDLPARAALSQRATYTLGDHIPQNKLDSISGPDTNNYLFQHQVNITCAGTRVLKIFVDTLLSNPSTTENATYSLDSIDLAEPGTPDIALTLCNSGASSVSFWIPVLISLSALLFGQSF